MKEIKLYRSKKNKQICGVIGGFADIFKVDATLLRVIYALALIFTGFIPLILAYFVCALIMPIEEPASENKQKMEENITEEK